MKTQEELMKKIKYLERELGKERKVIKQMQAENDELRTIILKSDYVARSLIDQLEKKLDFIIENIKNK